MNGWRERKTDILANYKAPVKFSAEGTPYVDSSVSSISPRRLLALIRAQMSRRAEQQTDTGPESDSA